LLSVPIPPEGLARSIFGALVFLEEGEEGDGEVLRAGYYGMVTVESLVDVERATTQGVFGADMTREDQTWLLT
jgi:hypothetical protein